MFKIKFDLVADREIETDTIRWPVVYKIMVKISAGNFYIHYRVSISRQKIWGELVAAADAQISAIKPPQVGGKIRGVYAVG